MLVYIMVERMRLQQDPNKNQTVTFNATQRQVDRLDDKIDEINSNSYKQYSKSDALRLALSMINDMANDSLEQEMGGK